MNKNKLLYEAPEAQTLVVRFEENIMSDPKAQVGTNFLNRGGGYGAEDEDYCDLD